MRDTSKLTADSSTPSLPSVIAAPGGNTPGDFQHQTPRFTPGPWRAQASPQSPYFDFCVFAPRMRVGINTENSAADAALIAAAPDLFAALDRVHDFLRANYRDHDMPDILPAVRQALAKARGVQS